MKVNIYDEDNIAKGKLILQNLAEDLKEYSKVSSTNTKPSKDDGSRKQEVQPQKKPSKIEDIEKMAESQISISDELVQAEESDLEDEDDENRPQYLSLELKSTVSFKEIDIDKMLEHTTLDDFLRGLYLNQAASAPSSGGKSES